MFSVFEEKKHFSCSHFFSKKMENHLEKFSKMYTIVLEKVEEEK